MLLIARWRHGRAADDERMRTRRGTMGRRGWRCDLHGAGGYHEQHEDGEDDTEEEGGGTLGMRG
eukprot:6963244-Pyramimonas_sp.AAC.1